MKTVRLALLALSQTHSQLWLDNVGQCSPLSAVLFLVFMDRISKSGQVVEDDRCSVLRIVFLLFVDGMVLPSNMAWPHQQRLQLTLQQQRSVRGQDETEHLYSGGHGSKLLVGYLGEEFKHLRILFTSGVKINWEADRQIRAVSTGM